MESKAPVSRVWRARWRRGGGVVGEGRRAERWRRCFLAVVRREDILGGEGGGVDWSWERVFSRAEVAMVVEGLVVRIGGSEMVEMGDGECVGVAMVAVVWIHSALRKASLALRWARTMAIHDIYFLSGPLSGTGDLMP